MSGLFWMLMHEMVKANDSSPVSSDGRKDSNDLLQVDFRYLNPFMPRSPLKLCCWWLICSIQNDAKHLKNDWNPSSRWVYAHLIRLYEGYPLSTNMTGLNGFQNFCILLLWAKVASASKGSNVLSCSVQLFEITLY